MKYNQQLISELPEQLNVEEACYAIDLNNAEMIVECLDVDDAAALLNQKDEYGYNAIMRAAEQGNDKAVSELIQSGADIDDSDLLGRTPLMIAVENAHANVVKILVEARAYINVVGPDNSTPLRIASSIGAVDIINLLIEGGANIQPLRSDGKTALHTANGDFDSVKALLDAGVKINHQDRYGRTALYYMVNHCKLPDRTMVLLLKRGAEPRIVEGGDKSIKHAHPELFTQEKLIIYAKYDMAVIDANSAQQIHELEDIEHPEIANEMSYVDGGTSVVSKILQERANHNNNLLSGNHKQSWVSLIKNKAHS